MPTRCNRWFLLQILLLAQHVSGTTVPIIRSSRVLYKWLLPVVFVALVIKLSVWCGADGCVPGLRALIRHTVQPFTESDDIRCCDNTICPLEDGHVNARNMSRIISSTNFNSHFNINMYVTLLSALNRGSVQPLRRARIPDAVFVQLFLLRMGMSRPETCRG